MRHTLQRTLTIAAWSFWSIAVVMALLEVWHLAHGASTDHGAATFALQTAAVATVFSISAFGLARSAAASAQ